MERSNASPGAPEPTAGQGSGAARPPTIRAVAARAGVSKSLVSLVLQGSPRVSDAKRQAVREAIDALGYRPNAAARSLVARRTHTVGVLVNDLRNPWFTDVLDGLNSVLHGHGLRMLMADGRLDRRTGQEFARTFQELRVDGLVVAGTLPDTAGLAEAAARLPTVIAGDHGPHLPRVDIVANDDERGARLATEHLLGLGHRRIAHVAGRGPVGELRRRGFEAAMRAHGADAAVEQGDGTEEGGYRAAVRLLGPARGAGRPTAVLAFNDLSGIGVLSAAGELGLRVPGGLSLVGYDNTYLARIRHLWLDSVDNAGHEVGRLAARCLLDRMAHPEAPAVRRLVAPELAVRGSSAPPGGGSRSGPGAA
ncbi:LacI family transcriptional regulator [Streptomyces sp. RS10V-4]|uniref:LacI family DNA-binding transcriptional regulator n=1 Tax=Streptomyces rhizoryzae TaxID=2932493 RepID=UPI002004A50C|nr:LacI family DNA-binding transcriptional regulator [Streptomyces rhizoryzae]MCK7625366.1 LacI family transcriptional regulator [Streptomyces rhizoryzae]